VEESGKARRRDGGMPRGRVREGARSPVWVNCQGPVQNHFEILHANMYILVLFALFV